MSFGVHAPTVGALRTNPFAEQVRNWGPVAIVILGAAIGLPFLQPIHGDNPGTRAAIETTITCSAVLSGGLFLAIFLYSPRLPDLLLLCALVAVALADFIYSAGPALAGGAGLESGGGARLACDVIVALAFAAAAFAPAKSTPRHRRRLVGFSVAGGAGAVALVELLQQATGPHWAATSLQEIGSGDAANHPVALAVHVVSAAVLLVSTIAFLGRADRGGIEGRLVAGAAFLLGLVQLQYLAMPRVATDWVTPREGLRLAAYALLLGGAYGQYVKMRRSKARAAISSERERIARDLHDGLAQDLACIAVQGQRLDSGLGHQHPLLVAARNALAASRGAIVDLTASTAPTTEAALRVIAAELEHRFDLVVRVRFETDRPLTADTDLEPSRRENVIRIAREAIVNAALHGMARHVEIVLITRGRGLVMRISDDGRGISDAQRDGFGLSTMRDRAATLGGELSTRRIAHGGTALELLVP
jgi:signal transduction histidine kinase